MKIFYLLGNIMWKIPHKKTAIMGNIRILYPANTLVIKISNDIMPQKIPSRDNTETNFGLFNLPTKTDNIKNKIKALIEPFLELNTLFAKFRSFYSRYLS